MILRMIVKLSLLDDEENLIKEREYGRGYLTDIDMVQAAEDWWRVTTYNNQSPHKGTPLFKKKRYPSHCSVVSRIADIFANQLKKTILNKFLCDRKKIEEEYEVNKENE